MKKTKSLRIAAAGLTGAVALSVGLTAGTAGASVTRVAPLAGQREVCNLRIDQRVVALQGLQVRIDATNHLTAAQKAPIDASIGQSITLLNTVYRSAVNSATTRTALNAACQSTYVDLRIFLVYIPQEVYTGQLDALGNYQTKLQPALDQLTATGADTTADQARMADVTARLADAQAKIASVSPASFNADPTGTAATWDGVRADIADSFGDLMQVRADVVAAGINV